MDSQLNNDIIITLCVHDAKVLMHSPDGIRLVDNMRYII
jgi:hypothetical protein